MRQPFLEFVTNELGNGVLHIACGLPATMKTETSEEIQNIKGYTIVRTDLIRTEVLKNEDIFDEKVASDMDKRMLVYDETFRQAEEAIARGMDTIIDATFVTQALRRRAAGLAAKYDKALTILQTYCPREVSIARILRRTEEDYESNALTEQAYVNNEKKFEKVDLDDLKRLHPSLSITHLIVNTEVNHPDGWYIMSVEKR